MKKLHTQGLVLILLIATVLAWSLPAWADHTGFVKGEYEVREDAQYVELAIETSCCPVGTGQVDYSTSNSTAIAGEDYQQTSGTLTYPAEQTIRVRIHNDELFEDEEQFEVKLSNYRGTFINRGRTTATVRIFDNDSKVGIGGLSQQTAGTSSAPTQSSRGGGQQDSRPRPIRSADDSAGSSDSIQEDPTTQDVIGTANDAGELDDTGNEHSAAQPISQTPTVFLIVFGSLLGLVGGVVVLQWRRRKSQAEA